MKKKIPLLFLTLVSVVFAGSARQAIADAAGLMKQADRLNEGHFYYQAEQLYRTIVENHPNTDDALAAQRKLVCVLIGAEKSPEQVNAEFNKLVTNFVGNENLPFQVHQIGFICRTVSKHEKAKYYYNYVIENFPDSSQAIFSQKDLVKTAIEAGDHAAEQEAIDELKTRFAGHPDLAKALCSVADGYIKTKKYDKANELNGYIVSNFLETDQALKAQKNLAKTYIVVGDKPNARAAIEKLLSDFADSPSRSAAIRSIAEGCRNEADRFNEGKYYYRAAGLYQSIVTDYPGTDEALAAQRKLVCVFIGAEKSSEQIDAEFNKLATNFAGNENLPAQIHKIGFNCRVIRNYQQAAHYYNYVTENFPDNPQAIFSQKDIVKAAIEAEDYTAEQQALDELKTKFAGHPKLLEALCSVADSYIEEDKYDKANELNEYIVSNFPQSEYTLRAQKNLVKSYISSGDDPNAQTAMDKLTTDFANHPSLPDTVRSIAGGHRKAGKYAKAIELYQSLMETYPNDPNKIHCQKGLAIANIWRNEDANDTATTKAVDTLITDFNNVSGFVYAVFRIGEEYQKKAKKFLSNGKVELAEKCFSKAIETWQRILQFPPKKGLTDRTLYLMAECCMYIDDYNNAMAHYKKVVDDWPNSKYRMRAQKYLAIANINIDDDPNAMAQIDRLIADFNDSPFLPRLIYHIGEEYYHQGLRNQIMGLGQQGQAEELFQKAIAVFEKIVEQLPPSAYTPKVYRDLIGCCQRSGEDEKMVGYCTKMVKEYPDNDLSGPAFIVIGWQSFKKGLWSEAVGYFESGLDKYPEKYRPCHILYSLGRAYEETGQPAKAVEVYNEFISIVHPDDPRISIVKTRFDKLTN